MTIPSEFNIGGVYLPPVLIATIIGTISAMAVARLLDRCRLSRFFFYPPLVFFALVVIFTVIVGTILIPI